MQLSNHAEIESQESVDKDCNIPIKILNKHLLNQHPILDLFDASITKLQPYWAVNNQKLYQNTIALFTREWHFQHDIRQANSILKYSYLHDQQLFTRNINIYLAFWGPFSLIFFANFFHNTPFQNSKFSLMLCGVLDILCIFLTAFGMYMYANLTQNPYNHFCQHLCVSSYVGLFTILYGSLCASTKDYILIPLTIAYFIICVFVHFSIYNKAFKPSLLQFCAIGFYILFIYGLCAVYYYLQFSTYDHNEQNKILLRDFTNKN